MTEDEVEDWLSVAAGDVGHFPADILALACQKARRNCRHHSHIVPAIIEAAEPIFLQRSRIADLPVIEFKNAPRLPPPKLTQYDVDRLPADLRRIGLSLGYLVQDEDGNVRAT